MNALANSQLEELDKFLHGYPEGQEPFSVARYTGQESATERKQIADNPPDILLTNFMMLELILTRFEDVDRRVVEHCQGLEFLVLDELHTYRGRQGADVAMLVRRLRERLQADKLVCIGTSATMSSTGTRGRPQQDRRRCRQPALRHHASPSTTSSARPWSGSPTPAQDIAAVKPLAEACAAPRRPPVGQTSTRSATTPWPSGWN
ncbi:MAG: DEAD/DEAH box helicase [Giesbergeria sp.]